jgi:hypothetical protein
LKAFRSRGVVLFANSKTDWDALPPGAKSARRVAGNYIPMVLVTTADGEAAIDAIPYETLKADARGAAKDLRDLLETVDVLDSSDVAKKDSDEELAEAATVSAPGEAAALCQAREWTNTEGKTITAAVKRVEGDNVVFEMNGQEVPYALANLSEQSREAIVALAKAK